MPLRPLAEKDLPLVRAWRNAPEVRRNMYSKHEITEAEHQSWFARLKDDDQSRWFIHENAAGQQDGVVYFTQLQPANGSAFWGFYAGENGVRGIGTHMEFEALEKAFSEFGLHKLNCEVLVCNGQVVNLHKKFGFKEEGLLRDFHFDGKNYVDVVRLGILTTEWTVKRNEIQARIAKLDALSVAKIAGGGGVKNNVTV
jgi:UDP-4-amino-4,6-dideoxy-N-acetyl-beta-L-altrosamine N-acetyltransferase